MNRRNFLTRLSTGLVGVCLANDISTSVLPVGVRTRAASAYLTTEYNRVCKGLGAAHIPTAIFAGSALFDAIKNELVSMVRLVDEDRPVDKTILFKTARLYRADYSTDPWSITFVFPGSDRAAITTGYERFWRS